MCSVLWVAASCAESEAPPPVSTSRPDDADASDESDESRSDAADEPDERGLAWPIDCIPDSTCGTIYYPDADDDGLTSNCTEAGPGWHQGTNIVITQEQADEGMAVRAAAGGEVLWVFDGKYDRCPNADEPDCADPETPHAPNDRTGYRVCTPSGPFCGTGTGDCFWCFYGGNLVVIRHRDTPGVFATRYDKLKRGSITVQPGDRVERGQKIGEAAAAGLSAFPGLHFEVWSSGFYELGDPWGLECSPSDQSVLWATDPPWTSE